TLRLFGKLRIDDSSTYPPCGAGCHLDGMNIDFSEAEWDRLGLSRVSCTREIRRHKTGIGIQRNVAEAVPSYEGVGSRLRRVDTNVVSAWFQPEETELTTIVCCRSVAAWHQRLLSAVGLVDQRLHFHVAHRPAFIVHYSAGNHTWRMGCRNLQHTAAGRSTREQQRDNRDPHWQASFTTRFHMNGSRRRRIELSQGYCLRVPLST